MSEGKRNIVVTGFGPFGCHEVNNSWECVKMIKSTDFERNQNVNLIIKEIPVVYEVADEIVPKLWQEYDPLLVVHVGVHTGDSIIVEKQAHGHGYVRKDVKNCCPQEGKCPLGSEDVISTCLDFQGITCDDVQPSTNAGRYLCEYTYYLSLSRDSARTLFVHVPPCGSSVSKETIVQQLCDIIEKCLNQLRNEAK